MADTETASSAEPAPRAFLRSLLGRIRPAYLPVLVTYFCYGASGITSIALIYFQKDTLGITPAEAAGIAFWVALPWSTKMVAGVASDVHPIFGSRRVAYLLVGALLGFAGYAWLATAAATKGAYLAAMVTIAVGFMVQDVVADALSVEVARSEEEMKQIQALGRMALLVGTISVGYLSGWLAGAVGPRTVFAIALVLPVLVAITAWFAPRETARVAGPGEEANPLGAGNSRLVVLVGLGYAGLGVLLEALSVPFGQEIILVVSGALIAMLLHRVGISRGVAVAAFAIFCFRAVPGAGQGFSYWAIDRLGFDQEFLGVLAQVSSVLSLVGLVVFRKAITHRPVSYTLFWVTVAGAVLYLPTIGLFYGVNEWFGLSPRMFAFIDTTISAPLGQLSMVPMLALIARSAPRGAEATMFAIMASLMNLALSASELGTRYLNTAFGVTQQDYSGLGHLLVSVGAVGLLPLLVLPLLRREEATTAADATVAPLPPDRLDRRGPHGSVSPVMPVTASPRKPRAALLRLLERDERLFAALLAFVMVGGLAALGLIPLRPRQRVDVYSLVIWFGLYKAGILALVTVNPRATRRIFTGALCIDLLLVFCLLYLTGGGDSPYVNLFFPLVTINAYYFGREVGLLLTMVAGLLYWTAARLAPPDVAWTAVATVMGQLGLPAFALGHVADRERRARAEVERLNEELTGTLTRLQSAQEDLVEAERMATVGRLSLKVAHEVRNPIAAIELNAELLGDMVQGRVSEDGTEATALVGAIRDQVAALDALTEEYLAFARFPRPQFEEDSVNEMVAAVAEFVRPLAARQGIAVKVTTDSTVPPMEIDRTLLRQAVLNLVKNGMEAASAGGTVTLTTTRVDETVEIAVSDTGAGISPEVGRRLFEQFFTTKPQGTGLGLSISRQILEEHGGKIRWSSPPGAGATFTLVLPIRKTEHV